MKELNVFEGINQIRRINCILCTFSSLTFLFHLSKYEHLNIERFIFYNHSPFFLKKLLYIKSGATETRMRESIFRTVIGYKPVA